MIDILHSIIGVYSPTGDTFGGADWEYIIGGLLFVCVVHWVLKFLFSLFK